MLNRNELIRLRQALVKDNKNILDQQLLEKLRKLINQPTIVYEVNGELYSSKKRALQENLNGSYRERVVK